MKYRFIMATAALCMSSLAAHAGTVTVTTDLGGGISGSFDVEERITGFSQGIYDVTNNTNGFISGFGVSNNFTLPVLYDLEGRAGSFACRTGGGCYEGWLIDSTNWDTRVAFTGPGGDINGAGAEIAYTFQDLFGDFATASGGDTVFNWFSAVDGSMAAGTSFDNWFGFSGLEVASSIIGLATDGSGGTTAFTAGMATPPAPQGPEVSPVPLPAAGWLMIVGMGGLFAARRRSTA